MNLSTLRKEVHYMLYPIQEENLIAYLEELSDYDEVERIELALECDDYDIYVAEMMSGREYFVIYNQQPLSVLAKSGICNEPQDAIEIFEAFDA